MLNAVRRVLPRNRGLAGRMERDESADHQLYSRQSAGDGGGRRGDWIGFILFGLNYSLLLAVLVGFSVLIPYIGAFVVTIPVVGVALFQFGLGTGFLELFCGLSDYSGAGWQPAGAGALLGSSQPASAGDYPVGGDFRRPVGLLGRLLRHSAGDLNKSGDPRVA